MYTLKKRKNLTSHLLLLGFMAIMYLGTGSGSAQDAEPAPKVSVEHVQSDERKRSSLLAELRKAVEQGNSGEAAEIVGELFSDEPSPTRVYGVMKHSLKKLDRDEFIQDLEDREVHGPAVDELLLLLCLGMGDGIEFLDRAERLRDTTGISRRTLRTIAQDAYSQEDWTTAYWGFSYLEDRYGIDEPWALLAVAEVSMALGKTQETLITLRTLTDIDPLPRSYRDRALILRARIHFIHDDNAEEALSVLANIERGRSRDGTEAKLLSTLIRFVNGSDVEPGHLVQAAAHCPDLEEANEALDFARFIPLLPNDRARRERVLKAFKFELQKNFCTAASLHRDLVDDTEPPLARLLLMRSAYSSHRCGDEPGALEAWELLLDDEEVRAVALLQSGDCYARMDMPDSASARYMRLLAEHPQSPHAVRARSRLLSEDGM